MIGLRPTDGKPSEKIQPEIFDLGKNTKTTFHHQQRDSLNESDLTKNNSFDATILTD
jgi:hypothetical protein